jgi:hypothetical protein
MMAKDLQNIGKCIIVEGCNGLSRLLDVVVSMNQNIFDLLVSIINVSSIPNYTLSFVINPFINTVY